MEKLHPGAKWLFRLRGYLSAIPLLFIFGWIGSFIGGMIGAIKGGTSSGIISFILITFFIYVVVVIVFAEIYARMTYKRWLYEFAKTGLKLERGIIWKRYSNIPYERVQNVDIHRGIFARMLGFSTIDIQTAGFHGGYGRRGMPRSEGHIPAVSIEGAEKIREFLMKKISKKGGQGM